MIARVADRSGWGSPGGRYPCIRTIEISDVCPVCGGPRGVPQPYSWYEDGETHCCDQWVNPCGQAEAKELQKARLTGSTTGGI